MSQPGLRAAFAVALALSASFVCSGGFGCPIEAEVDMRDRALVSIEMEFSPANVGPDLQIHQPARTARQSSMQLTGFASLSEPHPAVFWDLDVVPGSGRERDGTP